MIERVSGGNISVPIKTQKKTMASAPVKSDKQNKSKLYFDSFVQNPVSSFEAVLLIEYTGQ